MNRKDKFDGSWPKIQVALDLLRVEDAVRIAKDAYRAGVEWIEAGTPLIKNEGMHAVRELKAALPERMIVADMKTLDAGAMETEMAYEAGADIVSISGLSDDSTVRASAKVRDQYGRLLMADLLMSKIPAARARQLVRLGADIVCLHTGVDVQRATGSSIRLNPLIRKLTGTLRTPVAVAGGVNPTLAPQLVEAGVKVLIAGGWVTGSKNPYRAAVDLVSSVHGFRSD